MNCKHWVRSGFTLIELFFFIAKTGDLASELKVIKHPYSQGIKPQPGVEF